MISLRNRLLFSYLFLMVISLSGMVIALFIATGTQPAPASTTYERIAPLVNTFTGPGGISRIASNRPRLADLLQRAEANLPDDTSFPPGVLGNSSTDAEDTEDDVGPLEARLQDRIAEARQEAAETPAVETEQADPEIVEFGTWMNNTAAESGLRLLEITLNATNQRIVTYDTENNLERGSVVGLVLTNHETRSFGPRNNLIFGTFNEDGEEWLFAGLPLPATEYSNQEDRIIIAAEPRPSTSLQDVLADFEDSLGPALLQASLVGLFIAVLMSVVISQTIARPLQAAAQAATAVANGDLNQHVPITGPQEVRSVAHAFNRMSAEVKATQQAQRDFLANVSHDLKTPLTSIQGYAQAIVDGAARVPSKAAEIIYDEAARMNRMVVELTDLARIQVGQLSMKSVEIDVGYIATTVAQKLQIVADKQNIELQIRTESLPTITGDGDRMAQVFTNLVGNAIKYTQPGGKVRVSTRATADGVEVIIQDTGVGIPEEDIPRIFDRFYQVDKARGPSRGTGLGLAITYEIVQAHGGDIYVESKVGKGSTFTVWLPHQRETTTITKKSA